MYPRDAQAIDHVTKAWHTHGQSAFPTNGATPSQTPKVTATFSHDYFCRTSAAIAPVSLCVSIFYTDAASAGQVGRALLAPGTQSVLKTIQHLQSKEQADAQNSVFWIYSTTWRNST